MSNKYTTSPGHIELHKPDILRLWQLGLGEHRAQTAEHKLSHMYLDNPAGKGSLFLLSSDADKRPIGVQGLVKRQFVQGGRTIDAGLMADFVVDPQHRTLGPAIKLLQSVISEGTEHGGFVYGYPNRNSEPVIKRAGYELLGLAVRYARPIATPEVITQGKPSWLASLIAAVGDRILKLINFFVYLRDRKAAVWASNDTLDEGVDRLWETAAIEELTLSKRGLNELNWRYRLHHSDEWRTFTAHTREGGQLLGYIVWKDNAGIAYVGDFFALDFDETLGALLRAFAWHVGKVGCRSISIEFSGSPKVAATLESAGFIMRDAEPIYCIKADTDAVYAPWYLTAFDRDT